ncbi:MAG: matrixin family metalloprotease [Vampirovibrionales bacterium]|nr:matrixin family metalloprotease [Vampirovibrionales bacterium]
MPELSRTYLDASLRDGLTVRWPDSAMPIKVYIAPFRWYEKSKQQESFVYNQMVIECLKVWQDVTHNAVRFLIVPDMQSSQINFAWRRVDRKSLGHCEYSINKRSMVYSAEIQIGISDGILHAAYNDADEVRHTILHEIGHSLGLVGHSDGPSDIMYVPHQYGVVGLSPRDAETIGWLYKLPVGFNYHAIAEKHQLAAPYTLHDVIELLADPTAKPKKDAFLEKAKPVHVERPEKLLQDHDILTHMGKFHLATQNIQIRPDTLKKLANPKFPPPTDPHE